MKRSHDETMRRHGWAPDPDFGEKKYARRFGDSVALVLRLWPKGWGWRIEAPGPWPPGLSGSMPPNTTYHNRLRAADAALDVALARQRALEKGPTAP